MKRISLALLSTVSVAAASAAQAQTALGNGVSFTSTATRPVVEGVTAIDLGDFSQSTTLTVVSQMPMSLSYAGVDVGISFTGGSALYDGGAWAPGSANYLRAISGGTVTLAFSQAQTYFETRWTTQDPGNTFKFYNGDQLLASRSGAGSGVTSTVGFSFSELRFDKVVVSSTAGSVEFGNIRFGGPAPEAAPLPLGSFGGLIAFLGMMGARRRGLSWGDAMREANPIRKSQDAEAA